MNLRLEHLLLTLSQQGVRGEPHNKDAGGRQRDVGTVGLRKPLSSLGLPSGLSVHITRPYCKCFLYMQMNAVLSGWEIWPQKWINLTWCFTGNLLYEVSNVRLIWAKEMSKVAYLIIWPKSSNICHQVKCIMFLFLWIPHSRPKRWLCLTPFLLNITELTSREK